MIDLSKELKDWTDFDGAQFLFMQAMGLIPQGTWGDVVLRGGRKWIFWSANPMSEAVTVFMEELVEIGSLEREDSKYRWNPEFNPENIGGIIEAADERAEKTT